MDWSQIILGLLLGYIATRLVSGRKGIDGLMCYGKFKIYKIKNKYLILHIHHYVISGGIMIFMLLAHIFNNFIFGFLFGNFVQGIFYKDFYKIFYWE